MQSMRFILEDGLLDLLPELCEPNDERGWDEDDAQVAAAVLATLRLASAPPEWPTVAQVVRLTNITENAVKASGRWQRVPSPECRHTECAGCGQLTSCERCRLVLDIWLEPHG